jgi:hypothetical protein
MGFQPFVIDGVSNTGVKGYALGAYHPCWIKNDGEKIKNPAFDEYSQHVLNLKFADSRYFDGSVKYCTARLASFLKSGEVGFERAEFLVVQSSRKGSTSAQSAHSIRRGDATGFKCQDGQRIAEDARGDARRHPNLLEGGLSRAHGDRPARCANRA